MCQKDRQEVLRGARGYFILVHTCGSLGPSLVGTTIMPPEDFWRIIIGHADYGIHIRIVDWRYGSYEGFVVILSGSLETITLTVSIMPNGLA